MRSLLRVFGALVAGGADRGRQLGFDQLLSNQADALTHQIEPFAGLEGVEQLGPDRLIKGHRCDLSSCIPARNTPRITPMAPPTGGCPRSPQSPPLHGTYLERTSEMDSTGSGSEFQRHDNPSSSEERLDRTDAHERAREPCLEPPDRSGFQMRPRGQRGAVPESDLPITRSVPGNRGSGHGERKGLLCGAVVVGSREGQRIGSGRSRDPHQGRRTVTEVEVDQPRRPFLSVRDARRRVPGAR